MTTREIFPFGFYSTDNSEIYSCLTTLGSTIEQTNNLVSNEEDELDITLKFFTEYRAELHKFRDTLKELNAGVYVKK
jgi:flagellar biosynthesis chaperone FliJ